MPTANVRETRERLSHLLDAVAAGEEILIVRHGHPAARLVPVEAPIRAARASVPAHPRLGA